MKADYIMRSVRDAINAEQRETMYAHRDAAENAIRQMEERIEELESLLRAAHPWIGAAPCSAQQVDEIAGFRSMVFDRLGKNPNSTDLPQTSPSRLATLDSGSVELGPPLFHDVLNPSPAA